MAAITPRVLPDTYNLAIASATVITSISQHAAFPLAWLLRATPTQAMRTLTGWDVEAGFNNKLDFSEAGNVRVATLTAANYATGAAYATQLQTAMNAAPGVTNTYTVTYDGTTKKFTIARATGAAAVVLLWSTGANATTSCGKDLGFDTSADDSGSASYVADNAAYQSRRWLKFDLGSALPVTVGALLGHNLSAAGVATLQGNASALVAAGATGSVNHVLVGTTRLRILFFSSSSLRYWRLLVEDVQNTAGYLQLGVVYIGTYYAPSGESNPGFALGDAYAHQSEALTVVSRADQGAVYKNKKAHPRRYELSYRRLTRADKLLYQAIEDADPHLFLALDPQNYPADETLYGVIEKPAHISHAATSDEQWIVGPISFIEDLG